MSLTSTIGTPPPPTHVVNPDKPKENEPKETDPVVKTVSGAVKNDEGKWIFAPINNQFEVFPINSHREIEVIDTKNGPSLASLKDPSRCIVGSSLDDGFKELASILPVALNRILTTLGNNSVSRDIGRVCGAASGTSLIDKDNLDKTLIGMSTLNHELAKASKLSTAIYNAFGTFIKLAENVGNDGGLDIKGCVKFAKDYRDTFHPKIQSYMVIRNKDNIAHIESLKGKVTQPVYLSDQRDGTPLPLDNRSTRVSGYETVTPVDLPDPLPSEIGAKIEHLLALGSMYNSSIKDRLSTLSENNQRLREYMEIVNTTAGLEGKNPDVVNSLLKTQVLAQALEYVHKEFDKIDNPPKAEETPKEGESSETKVEDPKGKQVEEAPKKKEEKKIVQLPTVSSGSTPVSSTKLPKGKDNKGKEAVGQ